MWYINNVSPIAGILHVKIHQTQVQPDESEELHSSLSFFSSRTWREHTYEYSSNSQRDWLGMSSQTTAEYADHIPHACAVLF